MIRLFERKEIDVSKYSSRNIRNFYPDERAARTEYSRLRSIAEKRLERLDKKSRSDDPIAFDAGRVVESTGHFPKLKDLSTADEVYTQLERVARFVNSASSSVSTLRERVASTLLQMAKNENVQELVTQAKKALPKNQRKNDNVLIDRIRIALIRIDEMGISWVKYKAGVVDAVIADPSMTKGQILALTESMMQNENNANDRRSRAGGDTGKNQSSQNRQKTQKQKGSAGSRRRRRAGYRNVKSKRRAKAQKRRR